MPPDGPYQVFIEGPRSPGPDAVAALANAMAAQYGMPADTLSARLSAGRFRVKSSPDRAVAESFRSDLEALGAICSVIDPSGNVVLAERAVKPAPGLGMPSLPRTTSHSQLQGGLAAAAALSESAEATDLGALGRVDGELSLSALDGSTGAKLPSAGVIAPVIRADADAFAPPEQNEPIEMAIDMERPVRVSIPSRHTADLAAEALVAANARHADNAVSGPSLRQRLADPSTRFVVGVFVALLLAMIPAQLISIVRSGPALAALDTELRERQDQVVTTEDWQQLDAVRASYRSRKTQTRRDIALTSAAIWLVLAGGLGYVWFRRINWDAHAATT